MQNNPLWYEKEIPQTYNAIEEWVRLQLQRTTEKENVPNRDTKI